jgi:hypothetical protein
VANGLELLVIVMEGLRRDLALPVTGNPGQKPEEEKRSDDQCGQKERWHGCLSWQGELKAFILRADRDAFEAADTFTVAHGFPGSDLDGCRTDCLTFMAVNAQLRITSYLERAENGQQAKESAIGAQIATPNILYQKGEGHEYEHDRTGEHAGGKEEMEHLGIGYHIIGGIMKRCEFLQIHLPEDEPGKSGEQ